MSIASAVSSAASAAASSVVSSVVSSVASSVAASSANTYVAPATVVTPIVKQSKLASNFLFIVKRPPFFAVLSASCFIF